MKDRVRLEQDQDHIGVAGPGGGPVSQAEAARPAATAGPDEILVAVRGVSRTFGSGHTAVPALRDVSCTVRPGQLAALCGRSGSGKTTLLNIIGGLDSPTSGHLWVAGAGRDRAGGA